MNILFLCTYPVERPRHGGQLRARNIVDTYGSAGYNVEVIGVLGSDGYEKEKGFLPFPGVKALNLIVPNILYMEDYALGQLFSENLKYYKKLVALIKKEPDVIHVEQPWLYSFARRYISDSKKNIKIIYGSQNIEWQLKQQILSSSIDLETASKDIESIKNLELEAITYADAIICVSESDAEWIRPRTKRPVVVAPNGVNSWLVTEDGRKQALKITQGYKYALYCASAHPPNMTGFFNMFSGGFGSLKPDEKLVIVGGAGEAIAGDIRVHQSAKLAEKIIVAGIVDQPCLNGLLEGAHSIVLPLTQGGGTNLKTAEALWAGKYIVATPTAMRGFEQFMESNGVYIADNSSSFKQILRKTMAKELLSLTDNQINERKTVLWESCLEPLVAVIRKMDKGL